MEIYKLLLVLLYIIWTIISIKSFIDIKIKGKPVSEPKMFSFMLMLFWIFIHCGVFLFGLFYLMETYLSFDWLFYKLELWK